MKRLIPIFLACAALSSCAGVFISAGLEPRRKADEWKIDRQKAESRAPGILVWMDSLRAAGTLKDTFIVEDGIRLHSVYAQLSPDCKKTAVIVHGYKSSPFRLMHIARMFRDSLGYNVWMPSLRHHGKSEGRNIQMGWLDRLDVMMWSEIAHRRFCDTAQVFHGTSMGAACVMMTGGEVLPPYVKAIIEDCGYTNLYDEARHVLNDEFKIKGDKILDGCNMVCKRRYGWSVSDVSSEIQLQKCSLPILFIHGGGDTFVPTGMARKNYDAKTSGYRELWIAPGSKHARSYTDHPAEYTGRVRNFLRKIQFL